MKGFALKQAKDNSEIAYFTPSKKKSRNTEPWDSGKITSQKWCFGNWLVMAFIRLFEAYLEKILRKKKKCLVHWTAGIRTFEVHISSH